MSFWLKLLNVLVEAGAVTRSTAINRTHVKAKCATFGTKRCAHTTRSTVRAWIITLRALTHVIAHRYALMSGQSEMERLSAEYE
ncbi:hypothetical protein [Sphingomonas rubra]|uniref:hypothetical protein n=1 Tax=Sphingomonas rubra TaxID=634430 RepID=UPI0015A61AB8|nr:hypothetical protein [Sphingomonas rubra]